MSFKSRRTRAKMRPPKMAPRARALRAGGALEFRWRAGIERANVTLSEDSSPLDIADLRAAHPDHWKKAAAIRALTLDAVAAANSGHSGMPMGMADVATVLCEKHLKFDPQNPDWPDRDRLILSAGHGSMLLYALLHLTGYADMTLEEIRNFRQWGSRTAGHPEYGHAAGIETTTGPLGQGLSNAVGFAIAEESLRARYGAKLMDHHTYAIAGDGCLMEGVSHEAIGLAGRLRLSRLIVLWDNNSITIDGQRRSGGSHRSGGAVPRRGLGGDRDRRARPRRDRRRPDGGEGVGAAHDDRLQDPYRARPCRAGHRQGARRAHRCRSARRGETGLWLALWAVRDPRGRARGLGRDRRARGGGAGRLDRPARGRVGRAAGRDRAHLRPRGARAAHRPDPRAQEAGQRRGAQTCHPQVERDGARGGQPDPARDHRRLGGSVGVEQHPHGRHDRVRRRQPRGPLHPLRHPRAWHGRGDERHGAAWRGAPLWRHLHVLYRLRAPGDAAGGADEDPHRVRHDP